MYRYNRVAFLSEDLQNINLKRLLNKLGFRRAQKPQLPRWHLKPNQM